PGPQLHVVREHIAAHFKRLRTLVTAPQFRRDAGLLHGERLQRVPRGFPKDHPAADYLMLKQFLAGRELEAAFATSPTFYSTMLRTFQRLAPVFRFLNAPLLDGHRKLERRTLEPLEP